MQVALALSIMANAAVVGAFVVVRSSSTNQRILSKWLWFNAARMDRLRDARISADRDMQERFNERGLVIHD